MILIYGVLLFSFFNSLYADERIVASLQSREFNCKNLIFDDCQYTECRGRLPSYPLEILVSIPKEVNALGVHFHGHLLGKYPEYERDLGHMIRSFHINKGLCVSKKMMIFPRSEGNCQTYDSHLKDKQSLMRFFHDIETATERSFSTLSLSAHSGGGRTVSRILKSDFAVSEVTLYDGIYSENDRETIKNWYQTNNGFLRLSSVSGMTPEKMCKKIVASISPEISVIQTKINNVKFEKLEAERFHYLNRKSDNENLLKAHYKILEETWSIFETTSL